MSELRPDLKQYLEYIVNTGGYATVAGFDEDWEPIGPMLRRELMPRWLAEENGKLVLTEAGKLALPKETT
jgi:hypothetical protein